MFNEAQVIYSLLYLNHILLNIILLILYLSLISYGLINEDIKEPNKNISLILKSFCSNWRNIFNFLTVKPPCNCHQKDPKRFTGVRLTEDSQGPITFDGTKRITFT